MIALQVSRRLVVDSLGDMAAPPGVACASRRGLASPYALDVARDRGAGRGRVGHCGDDPVLWNELHSQRASSLAGRIAAGLGELVGIGVLALGTSWFALPAFSELAERGYGAAREGFTMPEVNPLARVLIGKLLIPAGSAAPGTGSSRVQHGPSAVLGTLRHALRRDGLRHRGHEHRSSSANATPGRA